MLKIKQALLNGDIHGALALLEKEPKSNFQDVEDFHTKYQVPVAPYPMLLNMETLEFRKKFMVEELTEFLQSHYRGDVEGCADALIDLVYVAMGTAVMMGLDWQPMWDEVQRANMSKVRATSASQSKRGTALDVVKPEGWRGPDHKPFVGTGPWETFNAEKLTPLEWVRQHRHYQFSAAYSSFALQHFCLGLNEEQVRELWTKTVDEYVREE